MFHPFFLKNYCIGTNDKLCGVLMAVENQGETRPRAKIDWSRRCSELRNRCVTRLSACLDYLEECPEYIELDGGVA